MPAEIDSEIRIFGNDAFHALAEKVIGIIFNVHNDFGRLMDEEVYKQAIHGRCESVGIVPARREVEIKVTFHDFEKQYFIDLLFADGLMVETKAVEKLNSSHQAQAIHYLLLGGMQNGLLVNLRPGRVEKRFVSTMLNLSQRRRYVVRDSDWTPVNQESQRLRKCMLALLDDWGAFLQTTLYRDAIVHFFGGPETALKRIPIYDLDRQVGSHEVCLLNAECAFVLTAIKHAERKMKDHLLRFLDHTELSYLQWINMKNHEVEFHTLTRKMAE